MTQTAGENILKVLSGNQFGVEVSLPDGTYTFGSGTEADIQLLDVALQPLHGHLRLRDGKIELRASQGDLTTASGLSLAGGDADWHEIAQMDAISAGMSRFVIGGAGANWSALSAPARPVAARSSLNLSSLVATTPRRIAWATGAALTLVALLMSFGSGGGGASTSLDADARAAAVAQLRGSIDAMPFGNAVTVTERADGTLAIEGYVEETVERRALQNTLADSGLAATLRVFVRQNLRADIQGTIESLGLPVDFQLDEGGNLALSGTVLDPARATELVDKIQTGVFGLASVRNDIRTAEQILAELRDIATNAGLSDLVIFRLDGLVVEATGIVPRDKMDNWVGLIAVYSRRFAAEIPLRSFVTLDTPAGMDTAPVIIGSGPVAEAETGRVVAPEVLAEPNEIDAQSLFAGQPSPAATDAAALPGSTGAGAQARPAALPTQLIAALDRLQADRPDLYTRLTEAVAAGETPDPALLQQSLTALGGTLTPTGNIVDGRPEIMVTLPGIGSLGSVSSLSRQITTALERPATASGTLPLSAGGALPAPPAAALSGGTTPAPLSVQPAPVLVAADATPPPPPVRITGSDPQPPATSSATLPGQPVTTGATTTASSAPGTEAPMQPSTPAVPQPRTAASATLPAFPLPAAEKAELDRMVASATALLAPRAGTPSEAEISPNLRALVDMQHVQLEMGRTMMRLPEPLSALPYPVAEPATCWSGAQLTPEMVPTILLLLDVLSLSSTRDITEIDPDQSIVLMETALSPDRVTDCLVRTRTDFGRMVANSSSFIAESRRNPAFAEFLFRNVPRGDLALVGANLVGAPYVELADGRKLGEGAAPDITSRILSIGDLGILLRTSEGTKVQLFGTSLGWRVVANCDASTCEGP